MDRRLILALAALSLLCPRLAEAQSRPPLILPESELFRYDRTIGGKSDVVETRSRLVESKGASWYEISSHSSEQDLVLRLDSTTLFATYSEVTSRTKDGVLQRSTSVLENRSAASPDLFFVLSAESLPYSLRAFPWGTKQRVQIAFMGSAGGMSFHFDFAVSGKELVKAAGRDIECWKTQLSLTGIMGGLFGKTYLWYSTEYPHYLVRSEGSSGPPGSPQSVLVLASYTRSGGGD
jgi:hypothetical protein